MLRLHFASIYIVFGCLCNVNALELTPGNWEKHTTGKTAFIKFFAPWCGHCKKIKPDWDKLMADFKGAPRAVVAEVDCTGDGKPLCEKHEVKGYPRLMWGNADKLGNYDGERSYESMKRFADSQLGASCGPGHLELCDANRTALYEKFMRIPPDKLEEKVKLADTQIKRAEYVFKVAEYNLTQEIRQADDNKTKKIKSIRKRNGLPEGPVQGALELSAGNWDDHVAGKTIFVKFFAPWCGHCKALQPDWDKLMAEFAGTTTALVAEVDCTGKGKTLCERHGVDGYPRLLWGKPDDNENLETYRGGRTYDDLKSFADDVLGQTCGPNSLDLCEASHRKIMEKMGSLSPEEREAKIKSAQDAISDAEKAFFDLQWNLTGQIDMAEMKKDSHIKSIKDQGLSAAKEVSEWNKKQPPGFWQPPANMQSDAPIRSFLEEPLAEVAGYKVTGTTILAVLLAFALPLVLARIGDDKKPEENSDGKSCEAKHILMESEAELLKVKARLDAGEDFAKVAAECSTCPSAKQGGSLGRRVEGSMSPEMNKVCFDPETEMGKLIGPIKTQFGYHLIVVESRSGLDSAAPSSEDKSHQESKKDE